MTKNTSIQDVLDLTQGVRDDVRDLKHTLELMNSRISTIEVWKAEIIGKLSIIVVFSSVALTVAVDWIKNQIKK